MAGHVPKPPYMEHYQARINAVAGLNCAEMPRSIKGTCWHTEVGYFTSTAAWFDNPNNGALTDFQIGGSWDGDKSGVIMRFIEEDQGVAPYANGRIGEVTPPFDEAALFISRWVPKNDLEQLNARTRSVELSDGGQPNRDRSGETWQLESLCFLTAYIHAEEIGQTAATFADNYLHFQTGTSHVGCPGSYVKTNKTMLRTRTAEIMAAYQDGKPLSRPLTVTYPPGWTGGEVPLPPASPGGSTLDYPAGWDASIAAAVWASLIGDKYAGYRFNEKGTVSRLWLNQGILSPLVYHFKDTTDGRELFAFAGGRHIGRLNSTESFREMEAV